MKFKLPVIKTNVMRNGETTSTLLNQAEAENEGAIPVIAQLNGQPAMTSVYWYLVNNSNTRLISRKHQDVIKLAPGTYTICGSLLADKPLTDMSCATREVQANKSTTPIVKELG